MELLYASIIGAYIIFNEIKKVCTPWFFYVLALTQNNLLKTMKNISLHSELVHWRLFHMFVKPLRSEHLYLKNQILSVSFFFKNTMHYIRNQCFDRMKSNNARGLEGDELYKAFQRKETRNLATTRE